jgi:hypothetical protein
MTGGLMAEPLCVCCLLTASRARVGSCVMIISASRRTDIPAFYAGWFMNRARAGFCVVRNPHNPLQESRVSLTADDVDVLVFWTRNPGPLVPHLAELTRLGHRFYFLFTIAGNPAPFEGHCLPRDRAVDAFRRLAERVGPERVIWRYDPIVLTGDDTVRQHIQAFERISAALEGSTRRCVISPLELCRKNASRMQSFAQPLGGLSDDWAGIAAELLPALAGCARAHGMQIQSCASRIDFSPWGIDAGRCIDDAYIRRTFGINVPSRKDPSQRSDCGCVVSRDIGAYDTCPCGCAYCYATRSAEAAQNNFRRHDPESPSLP